MDTTLRYIIGFFELGNMTSDNMEYMYNFSMSVYDVISDLNSLNGAMFMFVINGIIHRIISYVVTPQNVNTIESKKHILLSQQLISITKRQFQLFHLIVLICTNK